MVLAVYDKTPLVRKPGIKPGQVVAIDSGLVDAKSCTVGETWSGLKFTYRLRGRK